MDPATVWRVVTALMLAWLTYFFGRSLRPGGEALITRIARVSDPHLPTELVRYTRRLTAVWCAAFLLATVSCVVFGASAPWLGVVTWLGTALLFVGEHRLRPHLFPGHAFPGLRQQLRDTVRVWRAPRSDAGRPS